MNLGAIASRFATWYERPFKQEMSATDWFLFTGMVFVIIWLWSRVLREAGHFIGGE